MPMFDYERQIGCKAMYLLIIVTVSDILLQLLFSCAGLNDFSPGIFVRFSFSYLSFFFFL